MSAANNAAYLRRLREDAVARGLCLECRCRPARAWAKTCSVCAARKALHKKNLKAAGRCHCGGRPAPGLKQCRRCIARDSARHKRALAGRAAAGLCAMCKRPAEPGRAACLIHLVLVARRVRESYRRRKERS